MDVHIRYAEEDDVARATQLLELLNIESIRPAFQHTTTTTALAIAKGEVHVAVVGGEVVGVMRLCHRLPNTFEIQALSIDPEHQRLGIGRQLFLEAVSHALSARARGIYVGTMDDFHVEDFYLGLGMEEISDREHIATARFFKYELNETPG